MMTQRAPLSRQDKHDLSVFIVIAIGALAFAAIFGYDAGWDQGFDDATAIWHPSVPAPTR